MTIHALLISQYKAVRLANGENFDYFWVYLEELGVFWGFFFCFFCFFGYIGIPLPPWPTLTVGQAVLLAGSIF